MEKHIPQDKRPKTDKPSKEGTITVWDVKADGWRSFRYDRVTKVIESESSRSSAG